MFAANELSPFQTSHGIISPWSNPLTSSPPFPCLSHGIGSPSDFCSPGLISTVFPSPQLDDMALSDPDSHGPPSRYRTQPNQYPVSQYSTHMGLQSNPIPRTPKSTAMTTLTPGTRVLKLGSGTTNLMRRQDNNADRSSPKASAPPHSAKRRMFDVASAVTNGSAKRDFDAFANCEVDCVRFPVPFPLLLRSIA